MHVPGQLRSFNYFGGKYSRLPWLLPLLDTPHHHFVDLFGGSAVVLMNKPFANIETYNDLNGNVYNFFEVLRNQPDELIRVIQLTPYHRREYDEAFYMDQAVTPLERARRFYIRTNQSVFNAGSQKDKRGWASALKESRRWMSEKVIKYLNAIEWLPVMVERLKTVQFENKDFRYILDRYDYEDVLFYADPPYDLTYRSSVRYELDFKQMDFHDLHQLAINLKGKIAISGYNSPFMIKMFGKGLNVHVGPARTSGKRQGVRECLFTNY